MEKIASGSKKHGHYLLHPQVVFSVAEDVRDKTMSLMKNDTLGIISNVT